MQKVIQFGETVDGFEIPVLNEREIRAASGILFVFALIALMIILLKGDFQLAKYFVVGFLTDFIIRVFINPRFSPMLILGRFIVRKQTPEYVGAPQKKFAWKIGVILSLIMFVALNVFNTFSFITGIICLICLIFLFFEAAFGICIGCIFYKLFYKEKAQYCPGEICDINERSSIQSISRLQVLLFIGFVAYIILTILFFQSQFSEKPMNLWLKLQLK